MSKSNRFITADEVIAYGESISKDITDVERVFLKSWVYLGQRQLGFSPADVKTTTVRVEDRSFRKPPNLIRTKDVALKDDGGAEYDYVYRGLGKRIRNDNRTGTKFIELSEEADFFHIGIGGESITCADISYYSLPVNDDNEILIPERNAFALMHFLRYMISVRNGESVSSQDNKRRVWEKEADRVRAKNDTPDELAFKEGIVRKYPSMIVKPGRNR